MENPIIDNRIIKDKTFTLRFLSFALSVEVADACSFEERDVMRRYASELLEYQIQTATDKEEINYLERCNAKEKLKESRKYF
jgi:hypothetical protein